MHKLLSFFVTPTLRLHLCRPSCNTYLKRVFFFFDDNLGKARRAAECQRLDVLICMHAFRRSTLFHYTLQHRRRSTRVAHRWFTVVKLTLVGLLVTLSNSARVATCLAQILLKKKAVDDIMGGEDAWANVDKTQVSVRTRVDRATTVLRCMYVADGTLAIGAVRKAREQM